MRSLLFADLMRGLILFLVHQLPVDGIKISFARKKKSSSGGWPNRPVCVHVGVQHFPFIVQGAGHIQSCNHKQYQLGSVLRHTLPSNWYRRIWKLSVVHVHVRSAVCWNISLPLINFRSNSVKIFLWKRMVLKWEKVPQSPAGITGAAIFFS